MRRYVGNRYVPKIGGQWDNTKNTEYEQLTIVMYEGDTYTSKQFVPVGIDIRDDRFWVLTSVFNQQLNKLKQDIINYSNNVATYDDKISNMENNISSMNKNINDYKTEIEEKTNNQINSFKETVFDKINTYIMPPPNEDYTVNTTNLQTLLDKAKNGEKIKIIFPNGVYYLDLCIIYSNTELCMSENTEFNLSKSGNCHLFHNFNVDDTFINYNGYSNIYIHGGIFNHAHVISAIHGKNLRIENLTIKNSENDHSIEIAGCDGVIIRNCTFNGVKSQTDTRNYVEQIQIDSCTRPAFPHFADTNNITYDNTPNKNWLIENCHFNNNGDEGYNNLYSCIGNHSDAQQNHKNITIKNCTCENAIFSFLSVRNIDNLTVIDNTIKNSKRLIYCKHETLNKILCNNMVIKNNNCKTVDWVIDLANYNSDDDLYCLENVIIRENIFNQCSLSITGINNLLFKDNTIINQKNSYDFKRIIFSTFESNNITNSVYRPIGIFYSQNVKIFNNKINNISMNDSSIIYVNNSSDIIISQNNANTINSNKSYTFIKCNYDATILNSTSENILITNNIISNYTNYFGQLTESNLTENVKTGSDIKRLLHDGSSSVGEITLKDNIELYSMLVITCGSISEGTYKTFIIEPHNERFKVGDKFNIIMNVDYTLDTNGESPKLVKNSEIFSFTILESKKLNVTVNDNSFRKIEGIKFN